MTLLLSVHFFSCFNETFNFLFFPSMNTYFPHSKPFHSLFLSLLFPSLLLTPSSLLLHHLPIFFSISVFLSFLDISYSYTLPLTFLLSCFAQLKLDKMLSCPVCPLSSLLLFIYLFIQAWRPSLHNVISQFIRARPLPVRCQTE